MQFEEAKKHLKEGHHVRRKSWHENVTALVYKSMSKGEPKACYITQQFGKHSVTSLYSLTDDDKEGTDWEEVSYIK
jgi:hypothetical protein